MVSIALSGSPDGHSQGRSGRHLLDTSGRETRPRSGGLAARSGGHPPPCMTLFGVILLLVGIGLLIAEAHLPAAGLLGGAGVVALAGGCWLLIAAAGAGLAVGLPAAFVVLVSGAGALAIAGRKVRLAGRRAIPSGVARLPGTTATVRSWDRDSGQVAADGALWRARLAWPQDTAPEPGRPVVIEAVDNLTLLVRPAEPWELP